jgi:hypothetical protein
MASIREATDLSLSTGPVSEAAIPPLGRAASRLRYYPPIGLHVRGALVVACVSEARPSVVLARDQHLLRCAEAAGQHSASAAKAINDMLSAPHDRDVPFPSHW